MTENIEKVALEKPVDLELEIIQWGNGSWHIAVPKKHLPMPGVMAAVVEIDGIPTTLNSKYGRQFTIPIHLRDFISGEPGDTITVRVLGALVKTRIEADPVQIEGGSPE